MTDDATKNGRNTIIFDGWRSISISLFMALVGYSVMISVPVLSTALVEMLGFTEVQVGRVWGADVGGLSIGAILSALLVARVNRRHLVMVGVVLSIGANALCMSFVEYEQVLWLRVAAGVLEDPGLAGGDPDRARRLGAPCRFDVVDVQMSRTDLSIRAFQTNLKAHAEFRQCMMVRMLNLYG